MKKIISSVKGTREFYPQDMAFRNWLYEKIRQVSIQYGYQEYDGPFLEQLELYAAKSGEELVKEQSFVFPDRGGNMIALRPELTPSLARMVAQKQHQLEYPLRWWSFGPFWRYERPQKGRTREFFQWNIDLVGVNSPEADAELVAICADFFQDVGLTPNEVKILVNDRRLMEEQLIKIGIPADRKKDIFNLIDRQDKMSTEEWETYALDEGISGEQFTKIKNLIGDRQLYKSSPQMIRFFSALEALGVKDYVTFDTRVVRGLDYYTGIVFEARDIGENSRAVLGGGHYDNLVEDVGGDPLPGVGFAMGDVVIANILSEFSKTPDLPLESAKVLVTVFEQTSISESYKIADQLRRADINTLVYPSVEKLSKQFKFASRMNVHFVIVVGPDELETQSVQLKDLTSGQQNRIDLMQAIEFIHQQLAHDARA